MRIAFSLALDSAGNSIAARMAMMAITTSNSINVKAPAIPLDRPRRPALSLASSIIKDTSVAARINRTKWPRSHLGFFVPDCSQINILASPGHYYAVFGKSFALVAVSTKTRHLCRHADQWNEMAQYFRSF